MKVLIIITCEIFTRDVNYFLTKIFILKIEKVNAHPEK